MRSVRHSEMEVHTKALVHGRLWRPVFDDDSCNRRRAVRLPSIIIMNHRNYIIFLVDVDVAKASSVSSGVELSSGLSLHKRMANWILIMSSVYMRTIGNDANAQTFVRHFLYSFNEPRALTGMFSWPPTAMICYFRGHFQHFLYDYSGWYANWDGWKNEGKSWNHINVSRSQITM